MNARFWIYANESWVKITLEPGQSIRFCYGGPTEEGSHYHGETYESDGDSVKCLITDCGRDCDGRLDRYWEGEVAVKDLPPAHLRDVFEPVDADCPGYGMRPAYLVRWRTESECRRDEYAEAAGY